MDVLLQRHCAKHIYVIPEGLRELMSDISREVLRSQPTELYTFIADYLDALMITRENARVAAKTLANLEETSVVTANLLIRDNLTLEQADDAARIIQTSFRHYVNKKYPQSDIGDEENEHELIINLLTELNISEEEANAAAKIIGDAYRQYRYRKQNEDKFMLTGMIDWRVAARSTIALYRKTGVSEEDLHRAATLIKAAYKGYYTRRLMKRLLEEREKIFHEVEVIEEASEEDEEKEITSSLLEQPTYAQDDEFYAVSVLKDILSEKRLQNIPKILNAVKCIQRAYRKHLRETGRSTIISFLHTNDISRGSLVTNYDSEELNLSRKYISKESATENAIEILEQTIDNAFLLIKTSETLEHPIVDLGEINQVENEVPEVSKNEESIPSDIPSAIDDYEMTTENLTTPDHDTEVDFTTTTDITDDEMLQE